MTDYTDEYDYTGEAGSAEARNPNLVRDLREQVKAKSEEAKKTAEELTALREEIRRDRVGAELKTRGVNEKVASFIPSDVTTKEAIDKWLDENSDVFGIKKPEDDKPSDAVPDPQEAQKLQQVAELTSSGGPPANGPVTVDDINATKNVGELMELINKAAMRR